MSRTENAVYEWKCSAYLGLSLPRCLSVLWRSSKLPMEQLQLLLSDCGEAMGVQRGKELMLYHNEHQRLMASLLE